MMADSKQPPLLSPLPSIPRSKEKREQAPAEGAASFDEGRAPSLDAEELAPVSEDLIESLLSAPPAPAPSAFSVTLPFGAQSPLDQRTTSAATEVPALLKAEERVSGALEERLPTEEPPSLPPLDLEGLDDLHGFDEPLDSALLPDSAAKAALAAAPVTADPHGVERIPEDTESEAEERSRTQRPPLDTEAILSDFEALTRQIEGEVRALAAERRTEGEAELPQRAETLSDPKDRGLIELDE